MADQVRIPRSGVWHLRSKKDPRWNRTGQYSSLVGDPPLLIPTEAQRALEELHASLAEGPPDDLQQVSLPYPTPKFKRLFDYHVFSVAEKQTLFQSLTRDQEGGLSELSLNWKAGELCLGKPGEPPAHHFPAQFVGILDEQQTIWQWAWLSEGEGTLSPHALNSARVLREYGTQNKIPEMTYAEIPLGRQDDRPWFNVDYMAMVSAHVCQADCYVAMPVPEAPGLLMYWLVTAPGLLPKPPSESQRFFNVIREAMPHWAAALRGTDGREVVRAYANQKSCRVSEVGDHRLQVDTPSGEHLYVDFDESWDISGIELPAERRSEPKKASWLNRLLRGQE